MAGRATEILLEARDEVLATSAARAAAVAAAMDRGALRRVAHASAADAAAAAAAARAELPELPRRFRSAREGSARRGSVTLPCFTLRRPLRAGETRRLNLFEPRWLAMIDAAAEARGGDPRGAEIACGLAVNRRYVSGAWLVDVGAKTAFLGTSYGTDVRDGPESDADASDPVPSGSARSADLVVEPFARVAKIVDAREGTRAVTGARKMEVWIEGSEETRRAERFDASPAGYLRATLTERIDATAKHDSDAETAVAETAVAETAAREAREKPTRPTRVVCVVGLAHCNGVVSRLADANIESYAP